MQQLAAILIFSCILTVSLHLHSAQAQYDDDRSTRKLRLEDLEQEEEQRIQLQKQQPPLPPTTAFTFFAPNLRKPAQYRTQPEQLALYDDKADNALTARSPPAIYRDYNEATSQRFRNGYQGFDYNSIANAADDSEDNDDLELPAQQQREASSYADDETLLQQYRGSSAEVDGYALKQTPAAFVLVPPFGLRGSSAAHKQADLQIAAYHQQQYQQQLAIDPYASKQPLSSPAVTLQLAPAGVQYLTNNDLRATDYGGKPALEYGVPDAAAVYERRPATTTTRQPQSNQLAYAPQRSESGRLSLPTIPYPPSFISITTRRPPANDQSAYNYAPPFKPSQPAALPDFFAQRQSKSLLDSYIPSWVIHKMLQQHQIYANSYQLLGSPYKHHFKRESTERMPTISKRVVKKSLSIAGGEKMIMTAK